MFTIMVVEDNPVARKMVRVALSLEGHSVLEAPDGQTALDLAGRKMPDLVLMDLRLPDTSGYDVTAKLRHLPGGHEVPILAFSGILNITEKTRLNMAGFSGFVEKPVEPSRLIQVISTFLPEKAQPTEKPGKGKRVLLVDDDAIQRKYVGFSLSQQGFAVTTAQDGAEALELARHAAPDIILSDILMPRLDGFQLCLAIRRDPSLARIPIILTTSHFIEEEDRRLALQSGADEMLPRSPDVKPVIKALLACMGKTGRPAAAPAPQTAGTMNAYLQRIHRQLERQVAINYGLLDRTTMQASALSVLNRLSEGAIHTGNGAMMVKEVLTECLDACGISCGALFHAGQDGHLLFTASSGYAQAAEPDLRTLFGHPELLEQVRRSDACLLIPSPAVPEQTAEELLHRAVGKSALLVPLMVGADCIGALFLISATKDLAEEQWVAFARSMGSHFALGLALTRTVESLTESERRYRRLFETLNDGILLIDAPSNCIMDANPSMTEMLGIPKEALLGKTLEDLHITNTLSGTQCTTRDLMQENASSHQNMTMPTKNGRMLSVEIACKTYEVGGQAFIQGTIRDVTERKQLEAQATRMERMATLGQLLSGIAHDLKNPLFVLTGRIQLLKENLLSGHADDPTTDLGRIEEAAKRMTHVAERFLSLARPYQAKLERCAVDTIIKQTLDFLANEFIKHNITATTTAAAGLPEILSEPHYLHEVFLNLFLNALHAMSSAHGKGTLTVTAGQEENWIVVRVRDDGPGVAPENESRLFEPFFTTKLAGEGTGLGLWTVRTMLAKLNGMAGYEATPGGGSTFVVRLPIVSARHESQAT